MEDNLEFCIESIEAKKDGFLKSNGGVFDIESYAMLTLEKLGFDNKRVGTYFMAGLVENIYASILSSNDKVKVCNETSNMNNYYIDETADIFDCGHNFFRECMEDAFLNVKAKNVDKKIAKDVIGDISPKNSSECAYMVSDYLYKMLYEEKHMNNSKVKRLD